MIEEKGSFRKTLDYLLPIVHKYDAVGEAKKLLREGNLAEEVSLETAIEYIGESYKEYKTLLTLGKVADTADKFTSVIGFVGEIGGTLLGAAPGFIANLGEESLEMVAKLPFLAYLVKEKEYAELTKLSVIEATTMGMPMVGDMVDIGTNLYVRTACSVIRERAREKINPKK